MSQSLRNRLARLEERTEMHGDLTDADRAHMWAWKARVDHRHHGGPLPTAEQLALLARPGFWGRLQAAWGRPAFMKLCIAALNEGHAEHKTRLQAQREQERPSGEIALTSPAGPAQGAEP